MNATEHLKGKTIKAIFLDKENQHYLKFKTDKGKVLWRAVGGCCSESWFYQISGVVSLVGAKVVEVEEIDMGDVSDGKSRQCVDKLYGIKITTNAGHASIEFRNSSNGYYGGWLTNGKDEYGEGSSDEKSVSWQEITKDYQG